jgi:tetratricopeptide (TPR) repeat protein
MMNTVKAIGWIAGMLIVTSGPIRAADKEVTWRADYDVARKEASENGRPVFLEFHTEECFHCRRLEAGPLRDPAIVALLNERFVPLRVDASKSPKLTEALRIQAFPTMIIASADGKIIAFLEGYQEAKPLFEHLQRALAVQTPDWMARDFQEASKAIGTGDYAKAVSLLKGIIEDGKDKVVQTKAKSVLDEVEQQAAGRLVRVKQLQDKGQYAEAMDLLAELIARYAGTRPAADGAKLLTGLAERPEFKANQRSRRALDLLAQAREAFKAEKYTAALELSEILETTYKDLPEGRQGADLAGSIRSSPDKLALACEHLNERLASMYATLGETWLKKGERDLAAANFERAVRAAPASLVARDAQLKLTSLSNKPSAIPTGYQKPEK